jgi:acetyl esterase
VKRELKFDKNTHIGGLMQSGLTSDVVVEEIAYLSIGDAPLMMRLFRPAGDGPFPAVVECHGGGWCVGERTNNDAINSAVARSGIIVAAIDFRMPPHAPYPAAVADVNFATRWLKANAARVGTRPSMIGVMGSSSGGHLTLLSAMRPNDPRYLSIQRPGVGDDASVSYAVSLWPVICPQGRYRYLKGVPKSQAHPVLMEGLDRHDAFWGDEDAMAEGSPVCALERGEVMRLPDVLYVQNEEDNLHPRSDMDRFVSAFTKAGGKVTPELFCGASYDFLRAHPGSAEAQRALGIVCAFIKKQAGRA